MATYVNIKQDFKDKGKHDNGTKMEGNESRAHHQTLGLWYKALNMNTTEHEDPCD